MVNRIHRWTSEPAHSFVSPRLIWIFGLVSILLLPGFSAAAKVPAYSPRAHIAGIERSFVNQGTTPVPGAGVRFFEPPEPENSGSERFDIRWYANPPGIPPGALVMLEALQERNPVVRNHVVRTQQKSLGHIQSTIDIPAEEIRRAGRILKWRIRIIWRGRALASRSSPNWGP